MNVAHLAIRWGLPGVSQQREAVFSRQVLRIFHYVDPQVFYVYLVLW